MQQTQIQTQSSIQNWEQILRCKIFFYDTISSTSTVAKEMLKSGAIIPFFVIANKQTAGYGQYGNIWDSAIVGNLYMSYVTNNPNKSGNMSIYPQYIALKICSYLSEKFCIDPMVKWPNDIFIKKKKLGGILLESVKTEKTTSFVLGIGMNILSAPKLQHSQYEPTSIAELTGKVVNSADIFFEILKSILSATKNFQKLKINEFKCLWNKYDLLADKRVTVESGNNKFCGIARGIGDLGELLVETDDGKMLQFYSGRSKIIFSETFIV